MAESSAVTPKRPRRVWRWLGFAAAAVIVLIVAALIAWAVQKLPLPSPFGVIIQALILIIAAVVIAQRAGLF